MKIYRLLRNNKETGPFAYEELVGMGLKAYDLIWKEGKSAAWRYPSELPEFKEFAPVVEEQPFDRFFKRPEQKIGESSPRTGNSSEVVTVFKKEKPRIKIKADWRRIEPEVVASELISPGKKETVRERELPVSTFRNSADPTFPTEKTPTWKDAWLDWEQEKKTVQKLPKYSGTGQLPETRQETKLETKFSQSLDELKDRYAASVLKSREQKKSFSLPAIPRQYILPLILFPLLGLGIWMEFTMKSPQTPEKGTAGNVKAVNPVINPETPPVTAATASMETANTNPAPVGASNDDLENSQIQPGNRQTGSILFRKKHRAESSTIKLLQSRGNKTSQNQKSSPVLVTGYYPKGDAVSTKNVQASNGEIVRNAVHRNDLPQTISGTGSTGPAPRTVPITPRQSISDFVQVNLPGYGQGPVENYQLSVQNEADFPIDLAVVDIQYFDAGGRYQKGETVYVHNIPASQVIQVQVPDSKISSRISYKVSLISAAEKKLYLIAD